MRYMLLLYLSERPEPGTPEGDALYEAVRTFYLRCAEEGVLISSAPLAAPDTAVTVSRRAGRVLRTDGPYAETAEWLGGYFLLECRDRDQAVAIASSCPTARDGAVELRPIQEIEPPAATPGSDPPRRRSP